MIYIDVNWIHELNDEPIRLVSEIGPDKFEIRKLEFFRNGRVGHASQKTNSEGTILGLAEVPSLEEINTQPEFQGTYIRSQEFEILWSKYVANGL